MSEIQDIIENVAWQICDEYCKWPEKYKGKEDGSDRMVQERCENCPLNRIT